MTQSFNIGIIGAGLMGHGIALVFAKAGHRVRVQDPVEAARGSLKSRIEQSLKSLFPDVDASAASMRVSAHEDLAGMAQGADLIIEAAPEKLELKRALFQQLETLAPATCILASNTSVIQISKIMDGLSSAHRCLGTHWWNPPHQIPLVEVIKTAWTDPALAQQTYEILASVGKTPVMVEKDVPGFIGNRLQHALWREAVSLVENGICDAAAVDTVIKSSFGRRLAVLGPLENADLVGTDLSLDIHENVLFDLESRGGPSPLLQQMVADGQLGMKSGEGFYRWEEGDAQAVKDRVAKHLTQLETILPK